MHIATCTYMQPYCIYCISGIFFIVSIYIAYYLYVAYIVIYMYIVPILLLCPSAGAREMLWQLRQRGLPLLLGVPGGGQAWEAPTGSHTRVNLHELVSNEECT